MGSKVRRFVNKVIFAAVLLIAGSSLWIGRWVAGYAGTNITDTEVNVSRPQMWSDDRFFCAVVYHCDIAGLEYAKDECGFLGVRFYSVLALHAGGEAWQVRDSRRGTWTKEFDGTVEFRSTSGGTINMPFAAAKNEFRRAEQFLQSQRLKYRELTDKLQVVRSP